MLTLAEKSLGVGNASEVIALRMRADLGGWSDAYGQFDGAEPLACSIWAGDDGPVIATPPVRWWVADDGSSFNANEPKVEVDFSKEVMDLLTIGRWRLRVYIPDDDAPEDLVEARFKVVPGPDADSPADRLAYHTYKQLLDIAPWIEALDDDFHDKLGFAELASQARDWIDSEILTSARYQPCRWGWNHNHTTYSDALNDDRLDLTTLNGRLLSQASANYTLSLIVERAVSAKQVAGDALDPEVYLRKATSLRTKAYADFTGTGDDALKSVPLAYVPWGRVSR